MTAKVGAKDSIFKYGLKCRCPECGQGRLFNGFLTLAPRCEACGLNYSFADPADGPASFVMMTMAVQATAFGVWIELPYEPSAWVHLLTTLPFMLLSCIPSIRPFKGMLVASQYFHTAEEGRFTNPHHPMSYGDSSMNVSDGRLEYEGTMHLQPSPGAVTHRKGN